MSNVLFILFDLTVLVFPFFQRTETFYNNNNNNMVRSGILFVGAALIGCAAAFAPANNGSGGT